MHKHTVRLQRACRAAAAAGSFLACSVGAIAQIISGQLPVPVGPGQQQRYLKGPVGSGVYINVVIESDSVGIIGDQVTLIDSMVRAPVCVRTPGQGATLKGNTLDCGLCVEFTSSALVGNTLTGNRCSGRGTNRPDVFGW